VNGIHPTESLTLATQLSGKSRIVLDLFGGVTSQIGGAVNVDIRAGQGVRANISKGLPFRTHSVDEIIASGPRAEFLEEGARVLKKGGKIFINANAPNGFRFGLTNGRFPSTTRLNQLGLQVVQNFGSLPSRFSHLIFRRTDGSMIPTYQIRTTIYEKM
jgi:SAM-dependent methyltransferase